MKCVSNCRVADPGGVDPDPTSEKNPDSNPKFEKKPDSTVKKKTGKRKPPTKNNPDLNLTQF